MLVRIDFAKLAASTETPLHITNITGTCPCVEREVRRKITGQ